MNTVKEMFKDKAFLKAFIFLSIPIAMQNLLTTSINMLDNIMIGRLGEASIASVSLANQYFFVLNLILFGICSGCSVFTAQFMGKGDTASVRKVLGINVIAGSMVSLIFTVGAFLFPRQIMRLFTYDEEVIELGVGYLYIIAASYIPTAISFSFSFALKSTARTRLPLFLAFMSLCINGILNYILIFGKLGMAPMGVRGAAFATTITRFAELLITLMIVYAKIPELALKIRDIISVTRDFVHKVFSTTFPVIINESLWGLGVCMYSLVYGRMGTDVVAAVNIAATVEKMLNVFAFGIGHATAVMVGNEMGSGNFKRGRIFAGRFSYLSVGAGIIIGVVMVAISPLVLNIFTVSASVRDMAYYILVVLAVLTCIKNYNLIHIVGTLRSGGDTKFCLMMDAGGVWCISLPLIAVAGIILKWDICFVYMMFFAEEIIKAIIVSVRLKGDKWLNNLVEDI